MRDNLSIDLYVPDLEGAPFIYDMVAGVSCVLVRGLYVKVDNDSALVACSFALGQCLHNPAGDGIHCGEDSFKGFRWPYEVSTSSVPFTRRSFYDCNRFCTNKGHQFYLGLLIEGYRPRCLGPSEIDARLNPFGVRTVVEKRGFDSARLRNPYPSYNCGPFKAVNIFLRFRRRLKLFGRPPVLGEGPTPDTSCIRINSSPPEALFFELWYRIAMALTI